MSLDTAFLIARSGLLHTQRALANAADNTANVDTEGYTRKRIATEAVTVDGKGAGIRSLGLSRDVDTALVNEMNKRRSEAAAAELRDSTLSLINEAHGDPANGEALGDLVAKLRNGFIELRFDPSLVVKQQAVVLNAAQNMTNRFNDLSREVLEGRQAAHDGAIEEIQTINQSLRELAGLVRGIMERTGAGQSTADMEDKRDSALARLSEAIGFKPIRQPDGGLLLLSAGGAVIPLSENGDAFALEATALSAQSYYGSGGGIPPITMNGVDVTRQITGGRLGEYLVLRDQTLPRYQAELDIGAVEIAHRFKQEGLKLFADSTGGVPDPDLPYAGSAPMGFAASAIGGIPDPELPSAGSMQIGFAARIQINAAVRSEVRLLRDGTETIPGPGGFTPNPLGGPAGFTDLIDRILDHSFGETTSAGISWGGFTMTGLGPDGSLSSPFGAPRTIEDYAALITSSHTADSAAAGRVLATAKQFSEGLEVRFTRQSRVDIDSEMASLIQLQNAYAANARVISTAQSMWDTLVGAVR